MTARSILQVFDQYQKARLLFVQSVADLGTKPQNVECLVAAGVLALLHPLLVDPVPSIQYTAAMAIGRLANQDQRIAQAIVRKDILQDLLRNVDKQNKLYKKAILYVIRTITKHSPELASIVVQNNGLDAIVLCLEDFDPGVREAAAWALGYVARHNKTLAQAAVDSGAVPLLVMCLQEPELCLKQISASALCDIAKHNAALAETIVDAGALGFLARALTNLDAKLKRRVLTALSSVAKHSSNLAEQVIEAEVLPDVLVHMLHPDENVAKAAATLAREICKHSFEMAQLIVNLGGIGALIEFVSTAQSSVRLPGVMALGYIGGHSDQLAIAVIGSKGIVELSTVLHEEKDGQSLAVTAWAIGQIGKHTSEHAKAVAAANILPRLLELYNDPKSSDDLRNKCQTSLKQILQRCTHVETLESLLHDAPCSILKYVLCQFSKILPHDARARRLFVTSGGLKKVQEIDAEPGSRFSDYVSAINCCYPEEIVRYYSPGYPETLLEAVDQYQPTCPSLFAGEARDSKCSTDSKSSGSSYEDQDR